MTATLRHRLRCADAPDYDLAPYLAAGRRARSAAYRQAARTVSNAVANAVACIFRAAGGAVTRRPGANMVPKTE